MYKRVVVGTDGSDRAGKAVEHAATIAEHFGAELVLVQGCGSPVVAAGFGMAGDVLPVDLTEGAPERLEPIAEDIRQRGVEVQVHVSATRGHVALCEVAHEVDADLIVVGNRGMTGAARFLGSVPNSVAHQAPCSVLIASTD